MDDDRLFPRLAEADDGEAIRFGPSTLTYRGLRDAAAGVAKSLEGVERVVVWAEPSVEACVAVVGALAAGTTVIPVSPSAGIRELGHIVSDSAPERVLVRSSAELPEGLAGVPRADVEATGRAGELPDALESEQTAIVLYTSGTTGPPKGVMIPRRAIASNLDGQPDCESCAYNPYCGTCPAHNYRTQGSIFGRMRDSALCAVHKGIQDYLFEKLAGADASTRAILEKWTTARVRSHYLQPRPGP